MHSARQTLVRAVLTAAAAAAWLAMAGSASAAPGTPAGGGQQTPGYAGEQTCLTCHEAQTKGYHGSPHGEAWLPKSPAATEGCESCHGPGQAHVDGGGDKSKIRTFATPQDAESCTSCHDRATHALWVGSQHDQRNVACTSCHSVHDAKGPSQIKAASETALCSTCHRAVTNKQTRFNHMPVREGGLTCSSCHNVHGSQNVKLLKAGTTVEESCVSCHAEKRGPYLWEHAPVVESCTTCHESHGSNNDRMLVAKQPFLCQRCHVTSRHPPTVYEGYLRGSSTNANKIFGRSCIVCHQMVHGSNAPTGKAFLR